MEGTVMSHPNEELVRKGYEAFSTGDVSSMRQLLDPDVVWHAGGRNPLSGDYRGVEEVLGFFGRTMEHTQGSFRVSIEQVLVNDDGAAVVQRSSGERNGKSFDDRGLQLFRISDGKAVEVWQYYGDPYTVDEVLA
jgi:ketosteroid isomerase-like protein